LPLYSDIETACKKLQEVIKGDFEPGTKRRLFMFSAWWRIKKWRWRPQTRLASESAANPCLEEELRCETSSFAGAS
jgi:hypothetical protein